MGTHLGGVGNDFRGVGTYLQVWGNIFGKLKIILGQLGTHFFGNWELILGGVGAHLGGKGTYLGGSGAHLEEWDSLRGSGI